MNAILRVHYVYVKIAVFTTPSHIFNISFTTVFHFLHTSFTIPVSFIHYSYSTPTFLISIKYLKNLNILFIYIEKVHILFTIIDRFIHRHILFIFNPICENIFDVCEHFNTWIVNNLLNLNINNLFTISCLKRSYLSIYNLFTICILFVYNQE